MNAVVSALRSGLKAGDGFYRVHMKVDGQYIDIIECYGGTFLLEYPSAEVHHALNKKFRTLEDVAEFLIQYPKGGK